MLGSLDASADNQKHPPYRRVRKGSVRVVMHKEDECSSNWTKEKQRRMTKLSHERSGRPHFVASVKGRPSFVSRTRASMHAGCASRKSVNAHTGCASRKSVKARVVPRRGLNQVQSPVDLLQATCNYPVNDAVIEDPDCQ